MHDQCVEDEKTLPLRVQPIEEQYAKLAEFEVVVTEQELQRKASLRAR